MHWRDLLELAALAAQHADPLLACRQAMSVGALHQYWSASKARGNRWSRTLGSFSQAAAGEHVRPAAWCYTRDVVQEILASETLTRVWGAILAAHDQRHGKDEAQPVARAVLLGHLEARQRATSLILTAAAVPVADAVTLNRLRRRAERWTDLLIARVMQTHDVRSWAHDAERAADFCDELNFDQRRRGDELAWQLSLAAFRGAWLSAARHDSPNADLNGRLADAILGSLPNDCYDDLGLLRGAWLARLARASADTDGLIREYLALDTPARSIASRSAPPSEAPLPPRLRPPQG